MKEVNQQPSHPSMMVQIWLAAKLHKVHKWREGAQPKPDRTAVKATYLILATGAGPVLCLIPILGIEL